MIGVVPQLALAGPIALGSTWVYTWPYGESNACKCEQRDVGSYLEFATASDCLESFAAEEDEFCSYEGEGRTQNKCSSAISVQPGVYNSDCRKMCSEMLTGFISPQEFEETCKLEFVTRLGGGSVTTLPDSCFSNYVYGWLDFDPHNNLQGAPIGVYTEVETAAECQELCQFTPSCVLFSWRATCDDESISSSNSYQSDVNTCLLYDKDYADGVLNFGITSQESLTVTGNTEYCNVEQFQSQCEVDLVTGDQFYPFNDLDCLLCGCEQKCSWKSNSHITGPRFCGDPTHNACQYPLSDLTTTTTPAVCPTETCVMEDAESRMKTEAANKALGATITDIEIEPTTTTSTTVGSTTTGLELDTTTPTLGETTTGIELDSGDLNRKDSTGTKMCTAGNGDCDSQSIV